MTTKSLSHPCTAFAGQRQLLAGPLIEVALAVKTAEDSGAPATILVFDDATGRLIDLDLRGSKAEIISRLSQPAIRPSAPLPASENDTPRGRGRPRLGVIAREVTLLPRQWDWLSSQPGGASAVLRRLVDDAKRNGGDTRRKRATQEAAYHFMQAIAGDLPGFEEATRALFADDRPKLEEHLAAWPEDIRNHALRLAFPET